MKNFLVHLGKLLLRKQPALLIIFLLLVIAGVIVVMQAIPIFGPKTHRITVTGNGFSPNVLSIKQGEAIVFTTSLDRPFWPAADLHPTHQTYAAFDPKKPINAQDTWSFTFNQPGVWTFHDHLNPSATGQITVGMPATQTSTTQTCENLAEIWQRYQCWNTILTKTANEGGIEQAYEQLSAYYTANKEFASDCHSFTHTLGKIAYAQYDKTGKTVESEKTAYCGYGFYHGFMDTLILSGKDITEAKKYCDTTGKSLGRQVNASAFACYHGTGHGITDVHGSKFWADPQGIVTEPLQKCDAISASSVELYHCTTGVYNALEIMMGKKQYGLSDTTDNPFDFCQTQAEKYQEACMVAMVNVGLRANNFSLASVAGYIDTIQNDYLAARAMHSLLFERMRQIGATAQSAEKDLPFCRAQADRLKLPCIEGIAWGMMFYGEPSNEYKQTLQFCSNQLLAGEEQLVCYKKTLGLLRAYYTNDKVATICAQAPISYQQYCRI